MYIYIPNLKYINMLKIYAIDLYKNVYSLLCPRQYSKLLALYMCLLR